MFDNHTTHSHDQSDVQSDVQRLKKLNTFIQANPKRSAWSLQQWIIKGIKYKLLHTNSKRHEYGSEFIQALHLLLSLESNTVSILYQYLDQAEVSLLKDELKSTVTLGEQSLTEVILAFYGTCQDYEPVYPSHIEQSQTKPTLQQKSHKAKNNGQDSVSKETSNTKPTLCHLNQVPSADLALILCREQPQLIALVLSQFEGKKSAEILSCLPQELHSDICLKMTQLERPTDDWLKLIEESLLAEVKKLAETQANYSLSQLADLLNELSSEEANELLQNIGEEDRHLASQLEEKRFTFNDLICVDDRGIQYLIKEIGSTAWQLALRQAHHSLKEKIFSNMSQRAQTILKEELSEQPRRALSEIKKIQKEILQTAIALEKVGKISILHPAFSDHEYV